ncbi:cysteine synthase family protein [Aliarcobacter butzleri]|uniref:PLP-dependent cysteine synthase family protein n=1 Tax=Aliarcobacter butzleri TaxID=28197 RepID=UPI001EDA4FD3|nr:cysteine synthase family protein [Aliarcobacter butzleri]MCG3652798.1 cysteine synthase family protein [Aliarcobacter butzleri]MDN5101068.1 cysteine synthase family protein [Aliarcobacter butzleri]
MASKTILDLVGNTPLIKLNQITKGLDGVSIYAKCEYLNPSGSVKDRAAKGIILEAINSGKLTHNKILLDSTSGNTGIAYAMFGANLGYKVSVTLPKNANFERKRILKAFGATIIETDPLLSSDGALIKAKELAQENPSLYYYTNQYNNEENWKAHYNGTALEIWEQSEKKVTHFISGMGTSGTFVGTSRRLKELNPQIKTVAMQPSSPFHGLEGMKDMETTIIPEIYDSSLIDETIKIDTEDARKTTLDLIRKEGLFVGISSGGNIFAALQLAKTLPKGSVVVTILCDSGFKYLSDSLWEENL